MKPIRNVFLKASGALLFSALLLPAASFAESKSAERAATEHTQKRNDQVRDSLPFSNMEDFEDAKRGQIAPYRNKDVLTDDGRPVWTPSSFEFIDGKAPDTVNPSLWRHATLNGITGLFEVTDQVYQVRGAGLANLSIIEGDTGIIVIDSLMSAEAAEAGMELYYANRGKRPIVAFIYSHNHVDHFGGSRGVLSDEVLAEGKVEVIAPEGFMETLVAENVIAGPAMNRRIQYQFGTGLQVGEKSRVDGGLGQAISTGSVTVVPPTLEITEKNQKLEIDGVDIEFLLTPGAEAPAEMVMYFPQFKALNTAEIVTPLLHNLYAIRGASVRSGADWSKYISEIAETFPSAEVVFAQHHWPKWGKEKVQSYLSQQRDIYKFIHDQSVRLMNKGYTSSEIAEELELPESLAKSWWVRGYYGTVNHNAKAQYQLYLGWFDGNPASLNPLPPVESAAKFVEYMGGEEAILRKAEKDYDNGEYRWVAEVLARVVFANPDNVKARELQAAAFEQLGYQSESAIWRSAYLQGAMELRQGVDTRSGARIVSPDLIKAMTNSLYFDYLSVNLDPELAAGKRVKLNWVFEDSGETYAVNLENATLTYIEGKHDGEVDATITMTRPVLDSMMMRKSTFKDEMDQGRIEVDGSEDTVSDFLDLFDKPNPKFNIIEP